ncbi:SseB family protein [Klenkia brasiliensis]|uniref:SseB protein N-terminal domain-containing protein n=1 Tax=Klenkia brasiliensis TaxID=333142 RepID=A0A1G7QI50_9ACTN|nr:SseB family protein [Klenkia brasiliensis]SDF97609.1 SseB protein N-terminal domain-containing protein [Klenkia brasiliensis]
MTGPTDADPAPGGLDGPAFGAALEAAAEAGDTAACLALLRTAELALPLSPGAAAGTEPPAWPTAVADGRTWLLAYTSVDRMGELTGGQVRHCRAVTFTELAAGWPDTRWGLAVDPGAAHPFLLESGTVARLAAPTLVEDALAEPDRLPPVVQQVLSPAEVAGRLADGDGRVSGYVQHARDTAHVGAPTALLDAVGRAHEADELLSGTGSVTVLRWAVVGRELYRTPLGGTDDERCAAVAGWVVEEPPFTGTGFASPDSLVREYRVQGLLLPHGAQLLELEPDGTERRRALWDGLRETWVLVVEPS